MNETKIIKDGHRLEKTENGWKYIREFEAEMSEEEKQNKIEILKGNIEICKEELKKFNEEEYAKYIKQLEDKSAENLKTYAETLEKIDEKITRETEEEFQMRKQETRKELELLIQHHEKATSMAKDNLKKEFEKQIQKYENQIKGETEALEVYEKAN
jgi:uncharacterized protein (DUF305 family)